MEFALTVLTKRTFPFNIQQQPLTSFWPSEVKSTRAREQTLSPVTWKWQNKKSRHA